MSLGAAVEDRFLGKLFSLLKVPERWTTKDYAETHRYLGSEVSAFQGQMDCMRTPHMLFVMECLDNPAIKVIVGRKSAQVAWTETINSYISRIIDTDPQNIVIAFPREASAVTYSKEKFRPMVMASPQLLAKIGNPEKCSFSFFKFDGGFLKLVTAGSPTALKSTCAPILIIEEPADLKADLKGQGDALSIFVERQKTFEERKLIYGGTPSEAGFCKVEEAFAESNQMFYFVTCPVCLEEHSMVFDNLLCDKFIDGRADPIYGLYNPVTAYYRCPNCRDPWNDAKKNHLVLQGITRHNKGWKATAESATYGFAFNELLSNFPGSSLNMLAMKKLRAEVEAEKGKEGKLKSFVNNSEGLPYSVRSTNISVDKLKKGRLDYPEKQVPVGGVVLTMGIDVQHNRLAIIIRAWGRNGNSWLVYWGEIYGYVRDPEDTVWEALTMICLARYPHALSGESGKLSLAISAISIDSGDGNTTQLVYNWVQSMQRFNSTVYATKGSSDTGLHKKEIFTVPQDPDVKTSQGKRKKLLESSGIHVYMVGTQLAKDEVLRKLSLTGATDRSFHYLSCREDYEAQILSNRKKLSPRGGETRYEVMPGVRDEALDCEVLALHASRALYLHLWGDTHWVQAESLITQQRLKTSAPPLPNVTPGIN